MVDVSYSGKGGSAGFGSDRAILMPVSRSLPEAIFCTLRLLWSSFLSRQWPKSALCDATRMQTTVTGLEWGVRLRKIADAQRIRVPRADTARRRPAWANDFLAAGPARLTDIRKFAEMRMPDAFGVAGGGDDMSG